ncbi:hypothetical protein C8R42DRAFT_647445 [Lentinula raphanica]|nr:hypothetical protein C8R42DRAFT_647445 [Lentinula raphanica]
MCFIAIGMISVLALPVPDDSDIIVSTSPSASDVYAQASPQVIGSEILMSKRMDNSQRASTPPIPLEPPILAPARIQRPPFEQFAPDIYMVPAPLQAPVSYPAKSFQEWNQELSHFLFNPNGIKYEYIRIEGPEPETLRQKLNSIIQSELYQQDSSLYGILLNLFNEVNIRDPDPSRLKLFNAYHILFVWKRQVDIRIKMIQESAIYSLRYKEDYEQIFTRIKDARSLEAWDMINIYLADDCHNGYEFEVAQKYSRFNHCFRAFYQSGAYEAVAV